jgi:hypothetical protein
MKNATKVWLAGLLALGALWGSAALAQHAHGEPKAVPQATAAAAAVPASAAKPARKPKSATRHRHRLCTGWLLVVGRAQCRQPIGHPQRAGGDHAACSGARRA